MIPKYASQNLYGMQVKITSEAIRRTPKRWLRYLGWIKWLRKYGYKLEPTIYRMGDLWVMIPPYGMSSRRRHEKDE